MVIVRRNLTLHLGGHIGKTWFSPSIGGRPFKFRWNNPAIYQRRKRPLKISRYQDWFGERFMDYCLNDGIVKRSYRGIADSKRAEEFAARGFRSRDTKKFFR